jgi:predicted nucleic acid-binding protein
VNSFQSALTYVVDASVAFYGAGQSELFLPEQQYLSTACSWFLTRASLHGAELHVPSIFYTEVTTLVARDLIQPGVIDLDDGTQLLKDILSTNWEMHIAVFDDVLRIFQTTEQKDRTNALEYLALAEMLKCTLVTTDETLRFMVLKYNLDVEVLLVMEHPWANPEGLDDFQSLG